MFCACFVVVFPIECFSAVAALFHTLTPPPPLFILPFFVYLVGFWALRAVRYPHTATTLSLEHASKCNKALNV